MGDATALGCAWGLAWLLSLASMDESVHHLEALKYLPFPDAQGSLYSKEFKGQLPRILL